MQTLKIEEIIRLIRDQKTFEAQAADGSFAIKIKRYLPYCCAAIHDGSQLRAGLRDKIALEEYERWYEEDPHTAKFIASLPITLVGLDSRFEYDLNRPPEECIYTEAWGKKVWKKKLSPKEQQESRSKHAGFYKVTDVLIKTLSERFGSCVVYDIHSYNYKRWEREVPLFNVGTENVDRKQYAPFIDRWLEELSKVQLTGIEHQAAENDVFYGRGYFLKYITERYPQALVLATEIKKVYCDELTGESYPDVIKSLQKQLKQAILNHAAYFLEERTNWSPKKNNSLLDRKDDPALQKVDQELYNLVNEFELLAYVNPINLKTEQKRFFNQKLTVQPRFKYAPIKINPFELKQQLGAIRTQDIADVSIRHLYESVINSYFDKIDLLSTLNSKKFLYNSLRYFGRPTKKDLLNAQYLLHLPPIPTEPDREPFVPLNAAKKQFEDALLQYGIQCKVEVSNRVISKVMVLNSRNTIVFNPEARFTPKEVSALIEHEIGVHLVTTQNARQQSLRLLSVGLPVNTMTQEGLAILSEFLSGSITLQRLQKLALRVVVTDMMCNGADFMECFKLLTGQYKVPKEEAFNVVARIFRGGGLTKDYLYLNGFVKILKLWNEGTELDALLVGKTSLEFHDVLIEMIEREMINKPVFYTKSFEKPGQTSGNSFYDYIISGLK